MRIRLDAMQLKMKADARTAIAGGCDAASVWAEALGLFDEEGSISVVDATEIIAWQGVTEAGPRRARWRAIESFETWARSLA